MLILDTFHSCQIQTYVIYFLLREGVSFNIGLVLLTESITEIASSREQRFPRQALHPQIAVGISFVIITKYSSFIPAIWCSNVKSLIELPITIFIYFVGQLSNRRDDILFDYAAIFALRSS